MNLYFLKSKRIAFAIIGILLLTSFNLVTYEKEKVKIFVSWPGTDFLPAYEWKTGEQKPIGIEPALIERILEIAGYDYVYVDNYRYNRDGDVRIDAILDGIADISIRSITITNERKEKVNFSKPYFIDGLSAMTLIESQINSKSDFNNKTIYADNFTTAYIWAKEKFPDSRLVSSENFLFFERPEKRLLLEQIDVYLADRSFLQNVANKDTRYKVLDEKYSDEPFAIAVNKNKTKLLEDINAAIVQLNDSGEMQELVKGFENNK